MYYCTCYMLGVQNLCKYLNGHFKTHFCSGGSYENTYLCEGGTSSDGSVSGSGCPIFAMSTRCIARINSSAFSLPSLSTSARVLQWVLKKEAKVVLILFYNENICNKCEERFSSQGLHCNYNFASAPFIMQTHSPDGGQLCLSQHCGCHGTPHLLTW